MADSEDEHGVLHVLDLPQLYTKPSASAILSALKLIATDVPSWDTSTPSKTHAQSVNPAGLPAYLTGFIASSLSWIEDTNEREQIWDLASKRLTERSGRSAMPPMTRSFRIPLDPEASESVSIRLHEPSMTSDNLGLKTWAASYLLAKRLATLRTDIPALHPPLTRGLPVGDFQHDRVRVLELGSGTGLVGLAAAAVWHADVRLTDLPEIETNLAANAEANAEPVGENGGCATAGVLDWSESGRPLTPEENRYPVIVVADPLYSPEHPKLLVETISRWLKPAPTARVVVELPIREAYLPEVREFRDRMREAGLAIVKEGEEVGYDDWRSSGEDGGLKEVKCWWGIWSWATCIPSST
ncbi:MAG: hypothetical protein M4579_002438 [Chaenotheca gracillima]|nr:MAG: hypothetical protein M4579_002438 [Chaenotheca gracillima]